MPLLKYVPIYKRLTDFYSKKIYMQEYAPGASIDSINKMMERHKISRETAKHVIRKLIEQGLVFTKPGKGTFVPVHSATKNIWGVVVPFYSSNIEQLIYELNNLAVMANCELNYFLHYNNHEEEIRITGGLLQEGYKAIIVVPNYNEALTANYYKRLLTGKTKLILADNTMAGSFFNYVIQSYDLGVKRALDYMASKNMGNFLLLGNEIWKGQNLVFELMENTFRALIQNKYPKRRLFVKSRMHELNAKFIIDNNIGGILSVQDSDSIRIIGRIKAWGIKIPEQITLVSYGNTELTEFFSPGITAIDCNYRVMAESIAECINNSMDTTNKQVVIPPEIVIRET